MTDPSFDPHVVATMFALGLALLVVAVLSALINIGDQPKRPFHWDDE